MKQTGALPTLRHQVLVGSIASIAESHGPWLAVISSDDNYLSHSGGSSRDLWEAAGEESMDACVAEFLKLPVRVGSTVETDAGRLPARAMLHAITLDLDTRISVSTGDLHTFIRALGESILALQRKYPEAPARVLMPLVGAGNAKLPLSSVVTAMSRLATRVGFNGVQIVVAVLTPCTAIEEKFKQIEIWHPDGDDSGPDEEARIISIFFRFEALLKCCAKVLGVDIGERRTLHHLWDELREATRKKELCIPVELETAVEQAILARNRFAHRQVFIGGELLETLVLGMSSLMTIATDHLRDAGAGGPEKIEFLVKQACEKNPPAKSARQDRSEKPLRLIDTKSPKGHLVSATGDPREGSPFADVGNHVHRHEMQHVDNLVTLLSTLNGPEAQDLELLLDELQYKGERLLRLKEYCARMDPMEILRRLGASQLHRILTEKYDLSPKRNSKTDELAALILTQLGFPVQEPVEGISYAHNQVTAIRSRLTTSGHHERAGLVIQASSHLESSIRNLLRFICLQVYKRGPEKELFPKLFGSEFKDRTLDSLSLGQLLALLETLAKDLDAAPPEKRGYLDAPLTAKRLAPRGFDSITKLRNIFAHDRLSDNSQNDLSGKATEFLDQTLELLEFWDTDWSSSPPVYPKIIRVETITIDCWNRRVIRASTAEGVLEHIVTDMPVRAGGKYFMFPLSNPFRIDPLLIEFSSADGS